jgi:hypothetical protein
VPLRYDICGSKQNSGGSYAESTEQIRAPAGHRWNEDCRLRLLDFLGLRWRDDGLLRRVGQLKYGRALPLRQADSQRTILPRVLVKGFQAVPQTGCLYTDDGIFSRLKVGRTAQRLDRDGVLLN